MFDPRWVSAEFSAGVPRQDYAVIFTVSTPTRTQQFVTRLFVPVV
jgi:hypothetical protein